MLTGFVQDPSPGILPADSSITHPEIFPKIEQTTNTSRQMRIFVGLFGSEQGTGKQAEAESPQQSADHSFSAGAIKRHGACCGS
jgi:hypothetical protein